MNEIAAKEIKSHRRGLVSRLGAFMAYFLWALWYGKLSKARLVGLYLASLLIAVAVGLNVYVEASGELKHANNIAARKAADVEHRRDKLAKRRQEIQTRLEAARRDAVTQHLLADALRKALTEDGDTWEAVALDEEEFYGVLTLESPFAGSVADVNERYKRLSRACPLCVLEPSNIVLEADGRVSGSLRLRNFFSYRDGAFAQVRADWPVLNLAR